MPAILPTLSHEHRSQHPAQVATGEWREEGTESPREREGGERGERGKKKKEVLFPQGFDPWALRVWGACDTNYTTETTCCVILVAKFSLTEFSFFVSKLKKAKFPIFALKKHKKRTNLVANRRSCESALNFLSADVVYFKFIGPFARETSRTVVSGTFSRGLRHDSPRYATDLDLDLDLLAPVF
jgi:hypothetical protein